MVPTLPSSAVLLATLICIAKTFAQDQDSAPTDATETTTVVPVTPTSPSKGTPPVPTPSMLNPNHSYYPPPYRPPQGGYNPTNWNRYPTHQYTPGAGQPPGWYHRPSYRPPTSTYDWWKGFQRSPSFEPSGSSSNYWPTSAVPPSTGYGSVHPYNGGNGWQPYYIAVGYYRKSPTYPGYGPGYPSGGGNTGGYPPSYGRGYPYYGSGYPYYSGYGYGGYSQGYPSRPGAYYGGQWYPSSYGGASGGYPSYGTSNLSPPASYPSYPYHGGGYPGYSSYGSSYPNYYGGGYYGSGYPSSSPSYPYYGSSYAPKYPSSYTSYPSYGGYYGSGYPTSYPNYPSYGGSAYNYPYSGGYSTGKYTGSSSYPYGGQGGGSYPNYYYYNNRYYYPWYCCTYYPGYYNKGYATSGSGGVKQNVGPSSPGQKTGPQQAPKRSYVRRALRDQLRDQKNAEQRIEDLSPEALGGIQRYVVDYKPSMFKVAAELNDQKLFPTSLIEKVSDKVASGDENKIASDPEDQSITGEMVESYQRRLLALNRMFDHLISPNEKPEENYFQERVRTYNKLLSMAKQHPGLRGEADGKQQDVRVKLGQLMAMLKGYVFRHDAIGAQARRAVQAVYSAFHEPDLTAEDMLKVLSIVENLVAEILSQDRDWSSEKTKSNDDANSDSSSSFSDESKEPTNAIDSAQLYDRLEKLGGLYQYIMRGLLVEEKSDDDSGVGGGKKAPSAQDSADFQLKGSLTLNLDLQGKSNFGRNAIDNALEAALA
ncbi:unnamed protein product [Ixodes persulcatus]